MSDGAQQPSRTQRPTMLVALVGSVITVLVINATAGAFEPYAPANEQLRSTILGVVASQTLHPPIALSQRVSEALRSIKETEGQTNPRLAASLSTGLKRALMELERSWIIRELGYTEFDEEPFQKAEAAFQEVLTQFVGIRTPYSEERYQAAIKALTDAQALSRNARRAVPGLSSDDVQFMQEKRWHSLWKAADEETENPPLKDSRITPRRETAPSR